MRVTEFRRERPHEPEEPFFANAVQSYVLPAFQFQFDELRMFGAPAGDEDQVEEMVGIMQYGIESAERQRISSPAELSRHFAEYDELGREYGVTACLMHVGQVVRAARVPEEAG